MRSPLPRTRVKNYWNHGRQPQRLAVGMTRFPALPLTLPEQHRVQEHAQRHRHIRLTLVLDQHAHQRPTLCLLDRRAERETKEQVALPPAPVLEQELSPDLLHPREVE